jgi:1-deoxy-D-xylulose-5-phosphate synthase
MDRLLDKLATPADLRQCSLPQLERLAEEIRSQIIETISLNGGHFGGPLGWWS